MATPRLSIKLSPPNQASLEAALHDASSWPLVPQPHQQREPSTPYHPLAPLGPLTHITVPAAPPNTPVLALPLPWRANLPSSSRSNLERRFLAELSGSETAVGALGNNDAGTEGRFRDLAVYWQRVMDERVLGKDLVGGDQRASAIVRIREACEGTGGWGQRAVQFRKWWVEEMGREVERLKKE